MDCGLKDRVAVVTGGSSGIGLATVGRMLAEGAKVAFCARDEQRLEAARAGLEARFGTDAILAAPCDVLDADALARFRAQVEDRFGATDILVNNAGRARMSSFADTDDTAWREELELKFFGLIHPTRAFLPLLEASDSAAIVCINALLAQQPEPHLVATSAARAGALSLVKSLSREFAPKGIRVNSILLGIIESGQWDRRYQAQAADGETREEWLAAIARDRGVPLGRFGTPDEVAAAIVFLASPLASYITGAALDVSGGHAHHV